MRRRTVGFTLLFFLILSLGNYSFLYSDLDSFSNKVKDERSGPSRSVGSSSSDSGGGCGDSFGEAFGALLAQVAVILHDIAVLSAYESHFGTEIEYEMIEQEGFTRYPYSNDVYSNFVCRKLHRNVYEKNRTVVEPADNPNNSVNEPVSFEPQDNVPVSGYFYTLEGGGMYAHSNGTGFSFALSGRFWLFVGPEGEFIRISDGDDFLNIYSAGLNFAFIQTSAITAEFHIQYSGMSGVIDLSGVRIGCTLRSFPVWPFVLTGRYSYHIYEDIEFHDVSGQLGIILNRFEIYCGYRYMRAKEAQIDGPVFGLRIWL